MSHGLAVFVYPTLVVAAAAYAGALYFVSGRSRSALIGYVGAAAPGGLVWLAVLLHDGVDSAREVLALSRAVAEGRDVGLDRAISIVRDTAANFTLAPLALAAFVGAMVLYKRRPNLSLALLGFLPLLALPVLPVGGWTGEWRDFTHLSVGTSIHYMANLGLLALPLCYALRTNDLSQRLLIAVWIPAFVAGLTVSWSTFDGGGHQGIGFSAGAIVAGVLLALAVDRVSRQTASLRSTLAAPLLVALVPLAALVGLQFSRAVHDSSPLRLHSRIESGPYAGLFTTPANEQLLAALARDLRPTSNARCSILFYYSFPAGYLLTPSVPDTNTAFLSDREPLRTVYRRQLLRYYASRGAVPDVAVRVLQIPFLSPVGRPRYESGDTLDALIKGPAYERVATTASYQIYARRAGPCAPA